MMSGMCGHFVLGEGSSGQADGIDSLTRGLDRHQAHCLCLLEVSSRVVKECSALDSGNNTQ